MNLISYFKLIHTSSKNSAIICIFSIGSYINPKKINIYDMNREYLPIIYKLKYSYPNTKILVGCVDPNYSEKINLNKKNENVGLVNLKYSLYNGYTDNNVSFFIISDLFKQTHYDDFITLVNKIKTTGGVTLLFDFTKESGFKNKDLLYSLSSNYFYMISCNGLTDLSKGCYQPVVINNIETNKFHIYNPLEFGELLSDYHTWSKIMDTSTMSIKRNIIKTNSNINIIFNKLRFVTCILSKYISELEYTYCHILKIINLPKDINTYPFLKNGYTLSNPYIDNVTNYITLLCKESNKINLIKNILYEWKQSGTEYLDIFIRNRLQHYFYVILKLKYKEKTNDYKKEIEFSNARECKNIINKLSNYLDSIW